MKLHLPKALLTAVMALFAVSQTSWGDNSEIWVNFGHVNVDSETVPEGSALPSGSAWNNITKSKNTSPNGTYTLKNTAGVNVTDMTITSSSNVAVWGPSDSGTNVLEQLQVSYIDLPNYDASQTWGMTLTLGEIEVDNITLTLFMSGDGKDSNDKYAPVYVNGVSFVGGTDTQGSGAWGNRSTTASATHSTDNTIIVTGVSNNLNISSMASNKSTGGGRASIAGLSIAYELSNVYTATLNSNNNDATALSYSFNDGTYDWSTIDLSKSYIALNGAADNTGEYAISGGTALKGIQANSNTITVTSDGAIAVDKLWAVGGSTLNANFQQTAETSTVLGGLGTINVQKDLSASKTTVGTLQIAENATLTLTGTGSSITNVSGTGQISLAKDATIDIQSESGLTGTNPATNLKNLLSLAKGTGTINVSGGNEAFIAGSTGAANLWTTEFSGTISMAKNTKLVLGNLSTAGYTWSNWAVNLENATIETRGGGIRFNGERSTIDTLNIKEADTLVLQDGADNIVGLTIETLKLDANLSISNVWKGTSKIDCLTGNGDMIISAYNASADNRKLIIEIADIEDYTGSIQYTPNANSGLLKIGTTNGAIDLSSTIQSSGNVQFADGLTINITSLKNFDMSYNDEAPLWDVSTNTDSTETGNGFVTKAGSISIVQGGTNNLSDITVKYNNNVITRNDDGTYNVTSNEFGGDYMLGGTGENANGTMSNIVQLATTAGITLQSVTLGNGNKLTVDAAPTTQFNIEAGDGGTSTLDIAQGQTVSSAHVAINSGSMQFTGSGTYTMLGGLKGTAAATWTGHVYLEAKEYGEQGEKGEGLKSVSNLDLTQYGNADSKITLRGIDGSLASNTATIESDLEFLNSDGGNWAALCITSGEASSHTFTGDFSGSGNIRIDVNHASDSNLTNGMSFTFSGDVSKFTGQLNNVQGYNTYVFQGDATVVKANILAGGTMNIHTNNAEATTIDRISVSSKLNLENKGSGTMKVSKLDDATNSNITVTATSGNVEIVGYDRVNNQDVLGSGSNTTVASIDVAANKNVKVTGNLTVTGTLTVDSTNALTVHDGSLTLSGATVDASGFTLGTELNEPQYVYTLGTATGGISDVNGFTFTGPNVDGYKVDCLVSNANDINNVLAGLATADESSTVNDTLYLVLTKEATTTPLTTINVNGVDVNSSSAGALTLTTAENATDAVFGGALDAVMDDATWADIKAALKGANITLDDSIAVTFVGADGVTFDFGDNGETQMAITINGEVTRDDNLVATKPILSGDGAAAGTIVGNYVTAYIPEPTSTTLSLLALAALAVRRRRR